MNRFHNNCFSRFERTSRDEPSRSTVRWRYGPYTARRAAWRAAAAGVFQLAAAVGALAVVVYAPHWWPAVGL